MIVKYFSIEDKEIIEDKLIIEEHIFCFFMFFNLIFSITTYYF